MKIKLEADSQGFLIGDSIDWDKTAKSLSNIEGDISSILSIVSKSATLKPANTANTNRKSASPRITVKLGISEKQAAKVGEGFFSASRKEAGKKREAASQLDLTGKKKNTETVQLSPRDSKILGAIKDTREAILKSKSKPSHMASAGGSSVDTLKSRELPPGISPASSAKKSSDLSEKDKAKMIGDSVVNAMAGKGKKRGKDGRFSKEDETFFSKIIGSAYRGGMYGASGDDIDPAITAVKEVRDIAAPILSIASPVARSAASLFKKKTEKRKTIWLRKILTTLKLSRRDENQWSKKQLKKLKAIEAKKEGGGSGWFKLILMAITAIPMLLGKMISGLLLKAGIGAAIRAGAGSVFGGGRDAEKKGKSKGGFLKRSQSFGAKLSKKIPALAAILSLFSFASNELDASLSRQEKNISHGKTAGSLGGALGGAALGAAIGTAILPVVGTAVGAVLGSFAGSELGEIVGGKIGEFTNYLIEANIPRKISKQWESTTTSIKETFSSVSKWWKETSSDFSKVTSTTAEAVNNAIVENTNGFLNPKKIYENLKRARSYIFEEAKSLGGKMANAYPSSRKRRLGRKKNLRGSVSNLSDLIGAHEGGYGSYNRGRAGDAKGKTIDFSKWSLDQVMNAQSKKIGDPSRLFAVGKHQIIPKTMKEAKTSMGLTGKEMFTPKLQERIFREFLIGDKRPQIRGYITGEHDNVNKAALAGAREWASVEDPRIDPKTGRRTGRGIYNKVGGNKASITSPEFVAALKKARAEYAANKVAGASSKASFDNAVASKSSATRGGVSQTGLPTNSISTARTPVVTSAVLPSSKLASASMATNTLQKASSVSPKVIDSSPSNSSSNSSAQAIISTGNDNSLDVHRDVSDRSIAHIVTGGIAGMGFKS